MRSRWLTWGLWAGLTLLSAAPVRAAAYAVTPQYYDDIAAILSQLNLDADTIPETDLADLSVLSKYDAVFINCSGTIDSHTPAAVDALRAYVAAGGVIYASDWAFTVVQQAFPGYVEFLSPPRVGSAQADIPANVMQSSMRDYVGLSRVDIDFNLGGWVPIKSVSSLVTTYLLGAGGDANINGQPVLVKFDYGSGSVIYTSFHNEAGLTGAAIKSLEYMVLLSVLTTTANALAQRLRDRGYIPVQENLHIVAPSDTASFSYDFASETDTNLAFATAWRGTNHLLRLSVSEGLTPAGQAQSDTSPLLVETSAQEPATYGSQVASVSGSDSIPFVMMVGRQIPAYTALQIKAYPSPFRATEHSVITLEGMPPVATIKIYTMNGRLVKTIHKNDASGTAFWNVTNDDGAPVAPGLYLISAEAGGEIKRGKVVVLR